MKFIRLIVLLLTLAGPVVAGADEEHDRADVIATVQVFFDAMTTRDIDRMRSVMTPDGIIYGYREAEAGVQIIRMTHVEYLENLGSGEGRPVERFWDPEVMLYGRLATIWTPYDFYNDGEYSHCGVNNFSMPRMDDGWVITGVVFSIEQECAPSPLGPFEGR